jgi:hypothetical protein
MMISNNVNAHALVWKISKSTTIKGHRFGQWRFNRSEYTAIETSTKCSYLNAVLISNQNQTCTSWK